MNKLLELYTPKQIEIYKKCLQDDWFILINHGAKRSGKTILNNDLFLSEVKKVRRRADKLGVAVPQYILSGASLATINKNILVELYNKYGFTPKIDRFNSFELFGVKIVQTGHSTIGGLASIRGMTAFGAYINEASLANEEVFNEILSRCSGEGARVLVDTNPDYPGHWLNKNYITPESKSVLNFNFTLFDNTFLTERYIKNMFETTPSGMYTERNIYGKWTIGEGAVYSDFNYKKHYITEEEAQTVKLKRFFVGVDWGYEHNNAIVVIGVSGDDKYYLLEEHSGQHKEASEWIRTALDIQKRYGAAIPFYCDSARPDNIATFQKAGINALNANKSVNAGIEHVAGLLKQSRFFIVENKVELFKDEIYKYKWHPKSGKPIEENDDCMDALRYALYSDYIVKSHESEQTIEDKIRNLRRL